MKIAIDVKPPRLGQKVYVPSIDTTLGGLGTVHLIKGDRVSMKEVPHVEFSWETLARNQLKYVQLYGGSSMHLVRNRVA